jgi:hypothetical protein
MDANQKGEQNEKNGRRMECIIIPQKAARKISGFFYIMFFLIFV